VAKARRQLKNPEEGECRLLEVVTRGLVKTQKIRRLNECHSE
jgi:hypothetical protein